MLSSLIRRNRPRSEMSFMEHLDDLRISMIRVVTVFAVGMVFALIFYRETPVLLNMPLEWAKHPETSSPSANPDRDSSTWASSRSSLSWASGKCSCTPLSA